MLQDVAEDHRVDTLTLLQLINVVNELLQAVIMEAHAPAKFSLLVLLLLIEVAENGYCFLALVIINCLQVLNLRLQIVDALFKQVLQSSALNHI